MIVPNLSLSGKTIASTYTKVVQVSGSTLYDGIGNSIDFLYTTASVSLFAETASYSVINQVTQSNITQSTSNYASASLSSSWASQSLSASWSTPQFGEVTVVHGDGTISIYNPSSNTDIARGLALLTASANLATKDVIYLANTTYDISSSNIDLSNNKAFFGVSLIGSGKYSTQIKSSRTINDSSNTVIIQLGNASMVKDLSLICNASASLYQLPIGTYNTTFSQSIVSDVYINNGSDGIYINLGNNSSLTAYNVTVDSLYDCVTVGASSFTGSFYNCVFNCSHGSTDPFSGAPVRSIVIHATGATLNLWNCRMNAIENAGVAGAYGIIQTTGTTNIYGGSIYTNGSTNVFDISGSGTIGVTSNLIYNPTKVSGTLTYLDTQQIQASISSSVTSSISASWALSSFSSVTASFASRSFSATSASWASASFSAISSSFASQSFSATSASWASQSLSSSYLIWSANNGSSSWAKTASYAINGGGVTSGGSYNISCSWASSSLSASYLSGSTAIVNNLTSQIITASVYYNYTPYNTVLTSSTKWITCSFANPNQVVNLTISGTYSFTSSNMPATGNSADIIVFLNNSAAESSSLVFPVNWIPIHDPWPIDISENKSSVLWLRGYDIGTVIGTYNQQP